MSGIIKIITLISRSEDIHIPCFERVGFPKLSVPLSKGHLPGFTCVSPGTRDKGNLYIWSAAYCAMSKKSFIFDPGVSHLRPASMKFSRLTCELASRVKSLTLHRFLVVLVTMGQLHRHRFLEEER